jgi:hypothetical protein
MNSAMVDALIQPLPFHFQLPDQGSVLGISSICAVNLGCGLSVMKRTKCTALTFRQNGRILIVKRV